MKKNLTVHQKNIINAPIGLMEELGIQELTIKSLTQRFPVTRWRSFDYKFNIEKGKKTDRFDRLLIFKQYMST